MAQDTIHPEYLFRLARSGGDQDRLALAQSVISFMHAELSSNEQSIAEEILLRLLKEAAMDLRLALAEALSQEKSCPIALLDFLIYENPFEIAAPVLQHSSVLQDDYLIDVARHFKRTEYWQALARRAHVSEQLSRVLVESNDIDVYRLLLKNRGAHLCAASMNWLAEVASDMPELQKPLLTRPEVTAELATKLYWYVSNDLREQIVTRFDMNMTQVDSLLDQAVKQRLASRHDASQVTEGQITDEMIQLAAVMKEQNGITSHQLIEALKKEDVPFFVCLWAALLGIRPEYIAERLEEDFPDSLAVMCKTVSITRRDFNALFLLWRRHKKFVAPNAGPEDLEAALHQFSSMRFEDAWQQINEWKINSDKAVTLH